MSGHGPALRIGVNLLWLVPGVVGGSEDYITALLQGVGRLADGETGPNGIN